MTLPLRIRAILTALAVTAAAQLASAQLIEIPGDDDTSFTDGPRALVFALAGGATERTASGSGGTSLANLTGEDVAVLDDIATSTSAEAYLTDSNWQVFFGDADGDDVYWQSELAGSIDALVQYGGTAPHALFISPSVTIGSYPNVLEPGDIGRPRLDGKMDYLIRGGQIKQAFDIKPTDDINVDACAISGDWIFLSLEDDITTNSGVVIHDGDVLLIDYLFWSDGTVDSVEPDKGVVIITEAQIDDLVAHSGVSDVDGNAVTSIGDLDGLEIDPSSFINVFLDDGWNFHFHDLFFTGLNLVGGAVLTTDGSGSIAVIDGQALAHQVPDPTSGAQVGLEPDAHSLGDFALTDPDPFRFVLDTDTPEPTTSIHVAWGGVADMKAMLLAISGYDDAALDPGVVLPSTALPESFMHRCYATTVPYPAIKPSASGVGGVSASYTPPAALVGWVVAVQGRGLDSSGMQRLSAPIALQF
jgi:hypothetical protein